VRQSCRRALERYYLTAGSFDPIVTTIPKGSYVPAFSRGMREERPNSAEPKSASPREIFHPKEQRIRLLALYAFAVIVLVVAAWAVFQWSVFPLKMEVGSPSLDARGPNIPKLLVEPFQDVTGTADRAIAIGLTEQVVEKLARFKDLIVVLSDPRRPEAAGTNSVMRYSLAGSVHVEGDNIRLSARLIDRTNGSILWANSYDGSRTVRRVLDVEDDVARDGGSHDSASWVTAKLSTTNSREPNLGSPTICFTQISQVPTSRFGSFQ
jgi:TolB-like protein